MKIVVLDGYGLNPGDLSWERIEALGDLTVYPRTADEDFDRHAAGADILLTNKTILTTERIARLPRLKYIGVLATGSGLVDGLIDVDLFYDTYEESKLNSVRWVDIYILDYPD